MNELLERGRTWKPITCLRRQGSRSEPCGREAPATSGASNMLKMRTVHKQNIRTVHKQKSAQSTDKNLHITQVKNQKQDKDIRS